MVTSRSKDNPTELGPAPYPRAMPGSRLYDAKERRAYAEYVAQAWDEQTDDLMPLHHIWQQNLLFLVDQHWHRLGRTGWIYDPPEEHEERPVENLCSPFFNTYLAKVTKNRPATQVIPASSEPSDMQAAQLGDEVLEAKWVELGGQRRYREACGWTIATGNCFLLPYWNTNSGRIKSLTVPLEVPVYEEDGVTQAMQDDGMGNLTPMTEVIEECPCDEEGNPILGEDGRPKPGAKAHVIDEGEIDWRVYSPFQVRVNPEARADEDVQWFIVAEPMSLREIRRRWPNAEDVMEEDVASIIGVQQSLSGSSYGIGLADGSEFGASPNDERHKDLPRALVRCYYEKQSAEYPEGRYWSAVGHVLLDEPQELPDGLFKLIHMEDVPIPGRYHAKSKLESVVAINRRYNKLTARIHEWINLFTNGKLLVPSNAGIKKHQMNRTPGEVIRYQFPYKPEMLRMEPLPAIVFQERDNLLMAFERVSGLRAVSQGGTEGGVTAGIAIMQLQEADDADLGPFLQSAEEAVAALAGALLTLIKNNYDDERLYLASGPGRSYMMRSFRASDLDGAVDVVPQSGSSRPSSEVARQAVVMELAKVAPFLFEDPERPGLPDAARFARALQLGGLESAYESEDIDVSEALRIEEQFALLGSLEDQGLADLLAPQPWQNLAVHYRQHRRTLAGAAWKQWPEAGQFALLERFNAVKAKMDADAMQAAMMQAGKQAGKQPGGMPSEMGGAPPLDGMGMAEDPIGAGADLLEQDMEMASGAGILN